MASTDRFRRGERHHWWPIALSSHWIGEDNLIGRITPNGKTSRIPPKKIARISGGHNVDFGIPTPWNHTFEDEFDKADSSFSRVINWLQEIATLHEGHHEELDFKPISCSNDMWSYLAECTASLVIRSPKFREYAVSFAEKLRGPLPKQERKILISGNLMHKQKELSQLLNTSGKFVVFLSNMDEYIFGDGFYQNVPASNIFSSHGTRILIPITPNITILYIRPTSYIKEPRFTITHTPKNVVDFLNDTIQTYSKNELFFRQKIPVLSEHFTISKHLEYGPPDPIDKLINLIPGISNRSR